jgi:enamine deaminase RidA (YjgF/YER057c/UK114 family)
VKLLQPDGWAKPSGYSHGIEARGRLVFVAGQVGWEPASREFQSDDFVAQARQALLNVVEVLRQAGTRPEHLVRLTWYIVDRAEYLSVTRELGRAYREVIGRHYPPMTLVVVAGLLEPRARLEIEATALVPE